jgi:hypothetical protein
VEDHLVIVTPKRSFIIELDGKGEAEVYIKSNELKSIPGIIEEDGFAIYQIRQSKMNKQNFKVGVSMGPGTKTGLNNF